MWAVRQSPRSVVAKIAFLLALGSSVVGCGGGGGGGGGSPATQTPNPIQSTNTAPVANAGDDANAFKRETITLDGARSTDAENNPLTYTWTQVAGASVTLSGATSARPTFVAPAASGSFTFSLTVNDGTTSSTADFVTIAVIDRIPVASAGTNANVRYATAVTLDGRGSNDPDNDVLNYTWTQLTGTPVTLNTSTSGVATFTSPSSQQVLTFKLVVSDGELSSGSSEVVVSVTPTATNTAPIVDAGLNQIRPRRSSVTLSGYVYDPDFQPVQVQWRQLSGPTVTLSNTTSLSPTFTAPATPATFVFELSGSDGLLPAVVDTVTITIQNFAPTITASIAPTTPKAGDPIVATATTSDADLDTVTVQYTWTRNGVAIAGQTASTLPTGNYVKGDVVGVNVVASDGTTTATRTLTVTVQDTPPVFTAAPPTIVSYGGLVSFHITASDPDGDAVNFVIHHGPDGMQVNSSGDVTWTAKLPMFDTALDVDWGIGPSQTAPPVLSGTIKVTDSARKYPLARAGVQTSNLHHGILVTDLDGDGHQEMLIASGRMLYEYGRVGSGYAERWVYPFSLGNTDITSIAAADITGDGKKEIFVATGDHTVQLDGATRRIVTEFAIGANRFCRDLVVADLTNDGTKELICSSTSQNYKSRIAVFNLPSGSSVFTSPEFDNNLDIEVGNVDADAALEIIFSNGYVYDGSTFLNEWASSTAFGTGLTLGDVTGDGIKEVMGSTNSSSVTVWDVVHRTILWQATVPYYYGYQFGVIDVDGDGTDEIVTTGSNYYYSIAAYHRNVTTGATETVFDVPSGVTETVVSYAAGDINDDGMRELVLTAGNAYTARMQFFGMSLTATPTMVWNVDFADEPKGTYSGGQFAETIVGQKRLIYGAGASSNYGGPRIISLNPLTGAFTKSNAISASSYQQLAIDMVDYDGDGIEEAFVNNYNYSTSSYVAYDVAANTVEWQSPSQSGAAVAIAHGDFNGDGHADLVVATTDAYVTVYDPINQTLIWKSDQLTSMVDVAVGDLDGDGPLEIVAASANKLYVFEQTTGPIKFRERASITNSQYYTQSQDLAVGDTDGDGKAEIFYLSSNYTPPAITKYGPTLAQVATFNAPANSRTIELENLSSGKRNLIVGVSDNLYYNSNVVSLVAIDAVNGTKVWKSPDFIGQGQLNSLFYVDTNGDGDKELSFATSSMMYLTR